MASSDFQLPKKIDTHGMRALRYFQEKLCPVPKRLELVLNCDQTFFLSEMKTDVRESWMRMTPKPVRGVHLWRVTLYMDTMNQDERLPYLLDVLAKIDATERVNSVTNLEIHLSIGQV